MSSIKIAPSEGGHSPDPFGNGVRWFTTRWVGYGRRWCKWRNLLVLCLFAKYLVNKQWDRQRIHESSPSEPRPLDYIFWQPERATPKGKNNTFVRIFVRGDIISPSSTVRKNPPQNNLRFCTRGNEQRTRRLSLEGTRDSAGWQCQKGNQSNHISLMIIIIIN